MNSPPRVVIDANLHYSGLLPGFSPVHRLARAWSEGAARPLVSPAVLADTEDALRKKGLNLSEIEISRFMRRFIAQSEMLTPPAGLRIPQCRDAKDQPYLDLAYAAEADALVSGDKDLLSMAGVFPAPILNARDFMERFLPEG